MRDMGHINDSYWLIASQEPSQSDGNTGESNKSKLFLANNSTKDVRPHCSIGYQPRVMFLGTQLGKTSIAAWASDQDLGLGGSSESPNRS
jgi:hypothetical protein